MTAGSGVGPNPGWEAHLHDGRATGAVARLDRPTVGLDDHTERVLHCYTASGRRVSKRDVDDVAHGLADPDRVNGRLDGLAHIENEGDPGQGRSSGKADDGLAEQWPDVLSLPPDRQASSARANTRKSSAKRVRRWVSSAALWMATWSSPLNGGRDKARSSSAFRLARASVARGSRHRGTFVLGWLWL